MIANHEVEAEVARLRVMSIDELVARHHELLGRPPRTRHRASVEHVVAFEIQRRALGGLSPPAQSQLEQLIADVKIPRTPGPANATPRNRAGSGDQRRIVVAEPAIDDRKAPSRHGLPIGMVLVRTWHGRKITATARRDGLDVDDGNGLVRRFASLSAAARAITGAKWNGPLFFGLAKPREKRP